MFAPKTFRHQILVYADWPLDVTIPPFKETICKTILSEASSQISLFFFYFSVFELKSANISGIWNVNFYTWFWLGHSLDGDAHGWGGREKSNLLWERGGAMLERWSVSTVL